jgi:hypothetical protein
METVLTNDSAIVRLLGGDNRLTAVVIGGISMAIAAGLVTFVEETEASSGAEASTSGGPSAATAGAVARSESEPNAKSA